MDYSYIKFESGKSSKVKAGLDSNGNKRDLGFLECDFSTVASQRLHGAQKGPR
jgi:hypothetical protein